MSFRFPVPLWFSLESQSTWLVRLTLPIELQEQLSQREDELGLSSSPKTLYSWDSSPKNILFAHSGLPGPGTQWEMCFQDTKEMHSRSPLAKTRRMLPILLPGEAASEHAGRPMWWTHKEHRSVALRKQEETRKSTFPPTPRRAALHPGSQ